MKRVIPWLSLLLAAACTGSAERPASPRLHLVVVVVVDQFRYDYLTRFRSEYHGGLDRLLREGAVFTNARYAQTPTVTAVGHSVLLTGAPPSVSGIVGNAWFERETGRQVTSVCDPQAHNVGADTPVAGAQCEDWDAASPRRLLVSTVGDELRNLDDRSKVVSVSLKARSAVLPGGHRATGAYWFDDKGGNFITSDFYAPELPAWVRDFNRLGLPRDYLSRRWKGFESWDFHASPHGRPFEGLLASPWGNELVARLAEAAVAGEQLGRRGVTDLLAISFSSNDYVGHATGPDAPEVHDMCLRTDALLAHLLDVLAQQVGLDHALVVVTADHGVSPLPAAQRARRMPGGELFVDLEDLAQSALERRFGNGRYVAAVVDNAIYLDHQALDARNVDLEEACRTVAGRLLSVPQAYVARVYAGSHLAQGGGSDPIERMFVGGYYPRRSGDLLVVFEPYHVPFSKANKTTHFSPYNYDTHVPLIFFGRAIRAGRYQGNVRINDVAPTLAALMDVELPSGASGRVLTEMLGDW
jgi:hypothetical protein